MPKLAQMLKRSSGSRQVCVSVFFGKNNSDTLACGSCVTSLFLRHFDVICDLLLNRRTATWNLFVKGNPDKIMYDGHSWLDVLLTNTLPLLQEAF